jgi:hypothetical protein
VSEGASTFSSDDPQAEYSLRLRHRTEAATRWRGLDRRISNLRLVVFAAIAATAWFAFGAKTLGIGWFVLPIAVFVTLLPIHERIIRSRERADQAVAYYERALARLEHRWAGSGEPGEGFRDARHPYAEDLDLFGHGSLFELLCTARTRAGEQCLASWLRKPAKPDRIRARQAAVEELRQRIDLREDLALLGSDVRVGLHPEELRSWGDAEPILLSPRHRIAAPLLVSFTLAALLGWFLGSSGPIPVLLAIAIEAGYAIPLRKRVRRVIGTVDAPGRDLDLFAELLARLEQEKFHAPLLVELRAALDTQGVPPSRRIASLHRRIELLDARRNQLFLPVALLLLWTTQLALAIERWRSVCGPSLGRWIDAVGEFEALCALAGYAYEHPGHPFPEIADGGSCFEARAIGHPLIPPDLCVRNDIRLGEELRVLVVSGSNMSGKSTLLRTLGTNAVLAHAGAPVCASHLRLSPLAIGASICVRDSLQEGTSHFYAEITRMRQVMALAEAPGSTLFLLDEIFHGTNSHDRGIGAEAVVRGLLERGAVGLVTTHDLALARIADTLAPRAANVHFEDHLEDGKIAFDYRIRPGVVEKSNALELMRAVGLPV